MSLDLADLPPLFEDNPSSVMARVGVHEGRSQVDW